MTNLDNTKFGLVKVSLNDYPSNIASTIFINGCNLRCPFCQNHSILSSKTPEDFFDFNFIYSHLVKRKNEITAVCISGGEPTLFKHLKELVSIIKELGYKVKLDTNGTNHKILQDLNLDYIAMDIKSSYEKYHLCGNIDIEEVKKSIEVIKNLNIQYEFRTTAVRGLTDFEDFIKIATMIEGADLYTINNFRNNNVLDESYKFITPYTLDELNNFKKIFDDKKIPCRINTRLFF